MSEPDPSRSAGDLSGRATIAGVVAAIACCGIPLLVAAGLLTTSGVALRNLALIAAGVTLVVWLVVQGVRRARRQQNRGLGAVPPRSYRASLDGRHPDEE